jgi:hypothetical protein
VRLKEPGASMANATPCATARSTNC